MYLEYLEYLPYVPRYLYIVLASLGRLRTNKHQH